MATSLAPIIDPVIWYARYFPDDRTEIHGTAVYTPQGWTFTPEGGTRMVNVTLHDLHLHGQKALADAQHAMDEAPARGAARPRARHHVRSTPTWYVPDEAALAALRASA